MVTRKNSRSRSGIALTFLGVILLILVAFVAIGVDSGMFYMQQAELQITATAAAAGAALDLPSGATATAIRLSEANMPVATHGSVLTSGGVVTGNWSSSTRTFTAGGTPLNAVRVTTSKSISGGNPVRWLFGQVLGRGSIDMSATATAALLPELPGGIGGTGSITMSGNASIDSYESSQGPYNPATAGSDGDIVSNGTISLSGSSSVNGDVKGSSVTTGGNAQVSGSISPTRRPLDFPSVDTTDVASDNDNATLPVYTKGKKTSSPLDANRNFSLSGGIDYDIPPGTYYFNDLSLGGQSTLSVSGVTTIYLTGDLDTSGGDVINASQDPSNLRILMTGGTATINASVDWYGLLYAPDTDVTINGTGEVFGAIIGRDVDFGGTGDVHFDLNLTASDLIDGLAKRSAIVQ